MARAMKDSGIEWIGNIPNNWGTIRFKYLHNGMNTGESIDKEFWSSEEADTIFYTAGIEPIRTNYKDFPVWKYTKDADLLLARNGTPYVYLPSSNACYTDHIIRADMKCGTNRKFVRYSLQQSISSVVVDSVSLATWSASLWNEQTIAWPSAEEQARIVSFLDIECDRIDTVIEQTRTSIDEYKKLKQAVITKAVTKGIRPNRPMKESGIDWIREIPEDWGIIKGHRIISSTQNGLTRRDLDQSKGNIVLKLKNISIDGFVDYSYINRIPLSTEELERYKLENGDFLFVRVNGSKALVGKCAIFDQIKEDVAYNDHIIRVKLNNLIEKRFFQLYLLSSIGRAEIDLRTSTAAGQFTISGEGLREINVILPPKEEQKEITLYLNEKCAALERLIESKYKLLTELESYKKSLIYEYVTGKKEVPV